VLWLCRWQFQLMSVLASGSFGRVVRVQHRLLGKEYVIKRSATAITEEGIRRAWCQVRTGRQVVRSVVNGWWQTFVRDGRREALMLPAFIAAGTTV